MIVRGALKPQRTRNMLKTNNFDVLYVVQIFHLHYRMEHYSYLRDQKSLFQIKSSKLWRRKNFLKNDKNPTECIVRHVSDTPKVGA